MLYKCCGIQHACTKHTPEIKTNQQLGTQAFLCIEGGGGGTCQFSHDQWRVPPDSNRFTESRKTSRGPQGVTPQARSKLEASDQLSPAITVVSRMLHRFSRCWYGMSPHAVTDSFCISACLSIGSSHVNAESPW